MEQGKKNTKFSHKRTQVNARNAAVYPHIVTQIVLERELPSKKPQNYA